MTKYKYIILILALSFVFSSCETDFDTIAEWKDITVVYGLLDQKNSVQYIKINKAFLGDGNALVYAQEPDSSNYGFPLTVLVEERDESTNNLIRTLNFGPTTIYNKEPGVFYYPEQVIYKKTLNDYDTIIKIIQSGVIIGYDTIWLNENHLYKLLIQYPDLSKEISSETVLVHKFSINKPRRKGNMDFDPEPQNPQEFNWDKAENAGEYELKVKFHYKEIQFNSTDTINNSITFISATVFPPAYGDEISYYYWDDNFYSACTNRIPYEDPADEQNIKERHPFYIEIIVSAAENEFSFYMQVYEPSTSIVQQKPQYTNINNGIGIFSARYQRKRDKNIHPDTKAELAKLDGLKFIY